MSGSKQQVVYIGGGDSFSNHSAFLAHLKNTPLRDPKGEGGERWTKRLRGDLGEEIELFYISMPNSENAQYEEWKIWFERHFEYLSDEVILLGWSLGGMFLLKYLSEELLPFSVRTLMVLASPAGYYETEAEPGNDCGSFQFSLSDLSRVKSIVSNVILFHSKDDFVVPYEHALKLKEALPEAELITFEDRNHFLQAEFPELISKIKEISGK